MEKKTKITRKAIILAIEAGNISLAAIAREFGMLPGGSATVKLEEALPDIRERLKDAKSGTPKRSVSVTSPTATLEQKEAAQEEEATQEEEEVAQEKERSENEKADNLKVSDVIVHQPNPFDREGKPAGTLHSQLYAIGSQAEISRKQLVTRGMEATGRPEHTINTFISVLCDPTDVHNAKTSRNVSSQQGYIFLARCDDEVLRLASVT